MGADSAHVFISYLEKSRQIAAFDLAQHESLGKAHVREQDEAHPKGALLHNQHHPGNATYAPFAVDKLRRSLGPAQAFAIELIGTVDLVLYYEGSVFNVAK